MEASAGPNRCPISQEMEVAQTEVNRGKEEGDEQERGQRKPGNARQCIAELGQGPAVRLRA